MKIAIATRSTTYHSASGGMETHTKALAEGLVNKGHKVVVVTSSLDGIEEKEENGVRFIFLKSVPSHKYTKEYFKKTKEKLIALGERGEIEVIIGESAGASGYARMKNHPLPVLEIAHGSLSGEVRTVWQNLDSINEYIHFFVKILPYMVYAYFFIDFLAERRVERIAAVSKRVASDVRRDYFLTEKVVVVYNGIDTSQFKPLSLDEKNSKRAQLGFHETDKIILSLGRVEREKGIQQVVERVPAIAEKIPSLKLLVVGEGPYLDTLKEMVKKLGMDTRVVFTGKIPYEKVADYYAISDVFVLPTLREEGFPMTLIEAGSSGLPIVTANKGGSSEAIEYGVTGYSYEPRDTKQLERLLTNVLSNAEKRKEMSIQAVARAQELFSSEKMVNDIVTNLEIIAPPLPQLKY